MIALIGLRSPFVFYLLQRYIDKSGDVQTAAFVASYAFLIQAKTSQKPNEGLKKFIHEYRAFLNRLQLWYVRTDFDVSLCQLEKSEIVRRFE